MSSSSEPPSPTLGRTFLDRLTSVFHEEELNDRADVLEVLGEARRRNVIDDEVFSMMEGAMAVSEIRAGDLMVPRSQVQASTSRSRAKSGFCLLYTSPSPRDTR